MQNIYASVVLDEVIHACSLLAEDFANIKAIQQSSESQRKQKCLQWQASMHQIDYALHFIDNYDLSVLINLQILAIAAVAEGDLASSTQLFTLLSKAQHATSSLLVMRREGVESFPITLFSLYSAIHQILFQDAASSAVLLKLPQEIDLPSALKTINEAEATEITLQEYGLLYESALLKLLKQESESNIKSAAEQIALLFARLALLQKSKITTSSHTTPSREQLYSQIFQLYAQKIAEGLSWNLPVARKIFSALRKKIHLISVSGGQTLRGELLQEVLIELSRSDKKDASVIEALNYFDIERQLQLLEHDQTIWDEIEARRLAWYVFSDAVEQARNIVLASYASDKSIAIAHTQSQNIQEVLANLIKLAGHLSDPLLHSLKNWCVWLDTSSINEQEILPFLAYLLLLEQIALNSQEWEFTEERQSKLLIILSDVQVDISESNKLIHLGACTSYFERRNADLALLSGLQLSLEVLQHKLEAVMSDGGIQTEEKSIKNILVEIISILNFLNAEKLLLDFSHIKDLITQYSQEEVNYPAFVENIVNTFLLFMQEFENFSHHKKHNDELVQQVILVIKKTSEPENTIEVVAHNQTAHSDQLAIASEVIVNNPTNLLPTPLIASPALQKIYLKEAQQLVAQLHDALLIWLASPDEHILQSASHAAHSLAGSSATVGVPSMSALSTALEQVLQALTEANHAEVLSSDLLIQAVAALASQLQDLSSHRLPDAELLLIEKLLLLKDQLSEELASKINASNSSLTIDEHQKLSTTAASSASDVTQDEENFSLSQFLASSLDIREVGADDELIHIFLEEAADDFPQLDSLLRHWSESPNNTEDGHSILRILHTLKGSARMAGCVALGQHFHQMETEVEHLAQFAQGDAEKISQLLQAYDDAASALANLKNKQQGDRNKPPSELGYQNNSTLEQHEISPAMTIEALEAPQESGLLRVRTEALDRLAGSAAELIVDGARLSAEIQQQKKSLLDLSETLMRLRSQLRECELVAESSIASKTQTSQQVIFDPLEFDRFTRLQELTRMMVESMSDAASIERSLTRHAEKSHAILFNHEKYARAIQNDLKRVRVVRFASVSERLHHLVRQVARDVDKEVQLEITGIQSEIDRSLLDKIIAPLEHLLRNAIIHGIEASADRLKLGKEALGKILINLNQQGNEIIITVSDDGRGLDVVRIEERAKQMGLLAVDATPSLEQLTDLIFEPGFSTSEELTTLAGRGIGMNAVRDTILAQRGTIQVSSQAGLGASFTLFLPLSLATAAVVIIQHGERQFALPTNMVEQVLQFTLADLKAARQSGEILWRNQRLALFQLALLYSDVSTTETELRNNLNPVLVLRGVHGQIALEVQAILGNGEVVVRNIGPQVASVQGLVGASVMPDGSITLIINPLLFLVSDQDKKQKQTHPVTATSPIYKIMVVDDSLTVRRISQRLLERAGYSVLLARDGLHAIEILQTEQPSVILLDIEMPRMDGFELLHYLRQDAQTSELPIVMITSRTADKHRKHAMELGATAYLGKPFNETELLTLIKSFA